MDYKCKSCGAVLSKEDKVCPYCDTETHFEEEARSKGICYKCGGKLIPYLNVCPSCASKGASDGLNDAAKDLSKSVDENQETIKKTGLAAGGIMLLMFLLPILIFIIMSIFIFSRF